jgi:hypothetical protein
VDYQFEQLAFAGDVVLAVGAVDYEDYGLE